MLWNRLVGTCGPERNIARLGDTPRRAFPYYSGRAKLETFLGAALPPPSFRRQPRSYARRSPLGSAVFCAPFRLAARGEIFQPFLHEWYQPLKIFERLLDGNGSEKNTVDSLRKPIGALKPQLLFAPLLHGEENGHEALALWREGVFHARRHLSEVGARKKAVVDELSELLGKR